MSQDYAHALGARLRAIRAQQGLSLHGVEEKSEGRWKAVVVGSYERGDRAVTVAKLAELAEFYGVPVAELLPDARATRRGSPSPKLVIDLQRLGELPTHQAGPLARYAAAIQSQRGDYNGKILTIRSEDLRSLAVIYDMTAEDLTDQLMDWGVCRRAPSSTERQHLRSVVSSRRPAGRRPVRVEHGGRDPAPVADRPAHVDGPGTNHRGIEFWLAPPSPAEVRPARGSAGTGERVLQIRTGFRRVELRQARTQPAIRPFLGQRSGLAEHDRHRREAGLRLGQRLRQPWRPARSRA